MIKDVIHYTRELFIAGINNGANGNFSYRQKNHIYITRSGALSSNLNKNDFVDLYATKASSEAPSHQIIYENLPETQAVFHTHSPYVIALSLKTKDKIIKPIDLEGRYYCPEIPIIETELIPGAKDLPTKLLAQAKKYPAVIIKGHGLFVLGKSLRECYLTTTTVHNVCQIILM